MLVNLPKYFKFRSLFFFLLTIFVTCQNVISVPDNDHHLYKVFSSPELRARFSGFLDTILRQMPSSEFWNLIDKLELSKQDKTDIEIYEQLLNNIDDVKSRLAFLNQIKALKYQKKALGDQLQQLLKGMNQVENALEIGTPGTYLSSIKSFLNVSENIYVLNDAQKWTDYIQCFTIGRMPTCLGYDKFVPLNDYAEINYEDIPNNSIDLIVCMIGLHHIPEAKLDSFIASLHRVLKAGGTFILRDHDCKDEEVKSLIYAAHSIYNVAMTKESIESEKNEYRNFKSLEYWIALLRKHGFDYSFERLVQQNDPTLNTMVKFTKRPFTDEEHVTKISTDLKCQDEYKRELMQSYLSAPEWLNVDMAKEYAEFIEHTPFYEFPYFKNIALYWKVFANSFKAASREKGKLATLKSSYTLMNLFVGITMSAEYFAKGIISWPIAKMYAGTEAKTLKMIVADPKNELSLDKRIIVLREYPKFNIKLIEVPRYKQFSEVMKNLSNSTVTIFEIAGQKQIQVKIRYLKGVKEKEAKSAFAWEQVAGCKKEYEWTIPTQPNYTYAAFTVSVFKLKEFLKALDNKQTMQNAELLYIHDY